MAGFGAGSAGGFLQFMQDQQQRQAQNARLDAVRQEMAIRQQQLDMARQAEARQRDATQGWGPLLAGGMPSPPQMPQPPAPGTNSAEPPPPPPGQMSPPPPAATAPPPPQHGPNWMPMTQPGAGATPPGPPQSQQIGPPPSTQGAPGMPQIGSADMGQYSLQNLLKMLKDGNVPTEKWGDMLNNLPEPIKNNAAQQIKLLQAQQKQLMDWANLTLRGRAAEQADERLAQGERRADQADAREQRMSEEARRREERADKRLDLMMKRFEEGKSGGDWTQQDVTYWAGVLKNGGSLPARLTYTPGGKKLVSDIMKEVSREPGADPKEMLANQAEFMGEKAGQRTLGTRSANIRMAATEAQGLSKLAQKASVEWNRSGIKSLNDLQKYAQGKTASPELRKFVAANTSFINAYARAINPQGVGTDADKQHAREMLEVGFSKGDYQAAIEQLQAEIATAEQSPGRVRDEMRGQFTGKPVDRSQPGPTIPDQGGKGPKVGEKRTINGTPAHWDGKGWLPD